MNFGEEIVIYHFLPLRSGLRFFSRANSGTEEGSPLSSWPECNRLHPSIKIVSVLRPDLNNPIRNCELPCKRRQRRHRRWLRNCRNWRQIWNFLVKVSHVGYRLKFIRWGVVDVVVFVKWLLAAFFDLSFCTRFSWIIVNLRCQIAKLPVAFVTLVIVFGRHASD